MSADSADDLHHAEDLLTEAQLQDYCRPTCGALEYGADECDNPDCGCPCHTQEGATV